MQTFKLQVEDIIGRTISDADGLNDMLNTTAREVSDVLPKDVLLRNATVQSITSNSYDISNKRILSVSRDSHYATEIAYGQHGRATDSGSIYFSDTTQKRDPVFYLKGKLLVIQPEPTGSENGEIIKYDYPSSIAHGDTSISSFPSGAEYAVVLGTAAKFMFKLASENQSNEDIELATNTASFAAQLKQDYEKELQRVTQQK
jgi:hypothetical protein